VVGAVLLMVVALPAMANVDDGGFESPTATENWNAFTSSDIPGWTVAWADDYPGAPTDALLEFHTSNLWTPHGGNQYVELDSDYSTGPIANAQNGQNGEPANVTISQDVAVMNGYNYELSYWYSPRPDVAQNAIEVTFGDYSGNHSENGVGNNDTVWAEGGGVVEATGPTMTLSITETGPADSYGMFLDDVSCTFCVSDPVESDLVYGRDNVDVGDVTVTHDDQYVYVEFTVDDPWVIHQTHVELVGDQADFPQNGGGLIPGQFTYGSGPYVPGTTTDTVMIPIPAEPGTYYVAFHAELFEVLDEGDQWATTVEGYSQGPAYDPSYVIPEERSDPPAALGPWGETQFFSLGFGGYIEVSFGYPVYNGPGDDVYLWETTNGTYPLERADVYAVVDGVEHYLGYVTNEGNGIGSVDLGSLPYADSIKIVDTTSTGIAWAGNADGYDLNAVAAPYLLLSEESGWADTYGVTVGNNWSMYFPFDFNICPEE